MRVSVEMMALPTLLSRHHEQLSHIDVCGRFCGEHDRIGNVLGLQEDHGGCQVTHLLAVASIGDVVVKLGSYCARLNTSHPDVVLGGDLHPQAISEGSHSMFRGAVDRKPFEYLAAGDG